MKKPIPTVLDAAFMTGARSDSYIPESELPEIAIAGRSNVGNSSLLRILLDNRKLVRVSQSPGRTREVNFFRVETKELGSFVLADLPGYGYAKVPVSLKKEWGVFISSYLEKRQQLKLVVLLLDARRKVRMEEHDFIAWLRDMGIPSLVVITKIDKIPKTKRGQVAATIKLSLGMKRTPILFSALTKEGLEDVWRRLLPILTPPREEEQP